MVESFEPVSATDGVLTVRRSRPGAAAGTALQDMLAAIASRAAGRPVRVRVEAGGPAAASPAAISPPVAARPSVTLVAPARARPPAEPPVPAPRATPVPATSSDAAAPASPARASDDRAAALHPAVQRLSELFDARIVRIEAAGTLPPGSVPPEDPAESADGADAPDHAPDPDPADPGDR